MEENNETKKLTKKESKLRTKWGIVSLVLFIIALLGQTAYFVVHQKYQIEYTLDYILNIVNEFIIITWGLTVILLFEKNKIKDLFVGFLMIILTIINLLFFCKNGLKLKTIIKYSNDFSNVLVLKENEDKGEVIIYKNTKFIFTRPKEKLGVAVKDDLKIEWTTNDICSITYTDIKDGVHEYVATYGDRGNGISYNYVIPAISGVWQNRVQNEETITLKQKDGKLIITQGDKKEEFLYKQCQQYGTIALVLMDNESNPKYILSLNTNCKLDDTTDIIEEGGTITLTPISMDKTISQELFRTTEDNEE